MVTVDQRENLLILLKFLHEETDEDHPMTRRAILRKLESQGYQIARKQFNSDIVIMQKLGMDIVVIERANGNAYYWRKRLFETDELQLLADSVTSCKYLTEQRTQDMITRLSALTSNHKAKMLRKNICMTSHIKSMDDTILVNVGAIHKGMNTNKKICFYYSLLDVDKVRKRKSREKYVVSPYRVVYTEDWYYLIAYSDEHKELRTYRLDRMQKILVKKEHRYFEEDYSEQYLSDYIKRMFHMFGGDMEYVTLAFKRESAEIVLNQFGMDVHIAQYGEEFAGTVPVNISPQFYGWLLGLDLKVRLVGSMKAVMKYKSYLEKHLEQLPSEKKKIFTKKEKKKQVSGKRDDNDRNDTNYKG